MNEQDIIKQCQKNDTEAFHSLFRLYSNKAYRTAFLIVGNTGIAEDVVQESFIQCFREIRNLRSPDAFRSWFYRIVTRTSWRMASKEKKHTSLESLDSEQSLAYCSQQDFLQAMELKETCEAVKRELYKLDKQFRTVVVLHYFNGLSVKEISKIMNCFESTTKSRLYYARKKIGKELAKSSSGIENLFKEECRSNV